MYVQRELVHYGTQGWYIKISVDVHFLPSLVEILVLTLSLLLPHVCKVGEASSPPLLGQMEVVTPSHTLAGFFAWREARVAHSPNLEGCLGAGSPAKSEPKRQTHPDPERSVQAFWLRMWPFGTRSARWTVWVGFKMILNFFSTEIFDARSRRRTEARHATPTPECLRG